MSRTYKSLLAVAVILGVIAVAGLASAGPQRHFPFFPHMRPMPPTTPPGTTPPPTTNPPTLTDQQKMQLRLLHQQRLFMMMTLARMQSTPNYPMTMTSMGGMSSYPYPIPYPMSQPNVQAPVNNAAPVAVPPLLAGLVDAQGHVAWPLGLQILRPALETKDLRQRIEGTLLSSTGGRTPQATVTEAGQAVVGLRQALRNQRLDMAEATQRDAAAFLDRLEAALQAMGEGKGGY